MALPDLTHLQSLILSILSPGEDWGRTIREQLSRQGLKMSGPAFYQAMSRLEGAGYVRGRYETKVVESHAIKQRKYRLLRSGRRALQASCNFYSMTAQTAGLRLAGYHLN